MKKSYIAVNMMMEMCMCSCSMCMDCCARVFDMFSISEKVIVPHG